MKHKKIAILSAAALVLAGSMTIGSAMAYFTTYTSAKGGYTLSLGSKTERLGKCRGDDKAYHD